MPTSKQDEVRELLRCCWGIATVAGESLDTVERFALSGGTKNAAKTSVKKSKAHFGLRISRGPEFGASNGRGRFFTAREVRRFIHGGIPAWMKRRTLPMTDQSMVLLRTLATHNLQTLTYLAQSSLSRWLPGLGKTENF